MFPNENYAYLTNENLWFQQDGTPAYFALRVRNLLNRCFPKRWIYRRGTLEWFPGCPDLTPFACFLWHYSKVYIDRTQNLQDLRNCIGLETPKIIHNFQENVAVGSSTAKRQVVGNLEIKFK